MSTPPAPAPAAPGIVTLDMGMTYLDPDGRPYAAGPGKPVTLHYVIHTALFKLAGAPAADLVRAYALALSLPRTGTVDLPADAVALIRRAVERTDYIAAIVAPTFMALDGQGQPGVPGGVGVTGPVGGIGPAGTP
jgi:hypothetical protein